jgi:hypothetical protein
MVMIKSQEESEMALAECILEGIRVSRLTDRNLVREVLKTDALDHPCVNELLNRFMPGWVDEDWS